MTVLTPGTPLVSADAVISVEGLAAGTHRIRLEVEDDAGNRSAADERTVIVAASPPLITGVRPPFGAWGDEVVIVGSGFDTTPQNNEVSFSSGVGTAVTSSAATELRVRVPQPAVTGPVGLRNPNGTATSPRAFVIPRAAVLKLGGPAPVDLAHEPTRNELWVVHGLAAVGAAVIGGVSMLDLKTQDLVTVVAVQAGAREIAIGPTSGIQAAAVTNGASATTTIIDVASRKVRAHVPVSANPAGVAFRDGRIVYVVCQGQPSFLAASIPPILIVIDLTDQPHVVARIPLGREPARVVFSADRKLAFVNEAGDGTVAVIDANAHQLVTRVRVGGAATSQPSEVALSRETFPLLVANPGTKNLSVVDANFGVKDVDAGMVLSAAAIDLRSGRGWLAGPSDKAVVTLDLAAAAPKRLAAPAPGDGPKSVVMDVNGRGLFVSQPQAKSVTVYSASSGAVQAVVSVPDGPTRGVCTADGALACFICTTSGVVAAIDVGSVLP